MTSKYSLKKVLFPVIVLTALSATVTVAGRAKTPRVNGASAFGHLPADTAVVNTGMVNIKIAQDTASMHKQLLVRGIRIHTWRLLTLVVQTNTFKKADTGRFAHITLQMTDNSRLHLVSKLPLPAFDLLSGGFPISVDYELKPMDENMLINNHIQSIVFKYNGQSTYFRLNTAEADAFKQVCERIK